MFGFKCDFGNASKLNFKANVIHTSNKSRKKIWFAVVNEITIQDERYLFAIAFLFYSLYSIHHYRVLSLFFTFNTRVSHSDSLNLINFSMIIHLVNLQFFKLCLEHALGALKMV